MRNQQRVAIVTGASSGIGLATARALSKNGFRVFGTSRKPASDKDGVEMLQCDVVDEASVLSTTQAVAFSAQQKNPRRLRFKRSSMSMCSGS